MGDNHGGATAAVPACPVASYVFLISYLPLVLVPFVDVLACLHVVKLTSAYLLLTPEIKLTQKLLKYPNIKICTFVAISTRGQCYGNLKKQTTRFKME
jgi:hypothetical protein